MFGLSFETATTITWYKRIIYTRVSQDLTSRVCVTSLDDVYRRVHFEIIYCFNNGVLFSETVYLADNGKNKPLLTSYFAYCLLIVIFCRPLSTSVWLRFLFDIIWIDVTNKWRNRRVTCSRLQIHEHTHVCNLIIHLHL